MAALVRVDNLNTTASVLPVPSADNLNVPAALGNSPVSPTGLVATPLNTGASLTWSAPSGSFDSYQVTARAPGRADRVYTLSTDLTAAVLSTLVNTETWTLSLVALNGEDASLPTVTTVTPTAASGALPGTEQAPVPGLPDPPVLNTVLAGDESLQAQWTPAAWSGGTGILSWRVMVGELPYTVPIPTAVRGNVDQLSNGTNYDVQVIASNAQGDSTPSNIVVATPVAGRTHYTPEEVEPPTTVLIPAPTMVAFSPQSTFAPGRWIGVTSEVRGPIKQLALVETYRDPTTGIARVSDSFPITPSCGVVWYTSVDFGAPDSRASVQELPEADGTLDTTRYTGARQVSIEGVVLDNAYGEMPAANGWNTAVGWNSASWFTSLLSGWASPARRFRLYWTDEIGRSRFMDVRGDTFTSQVDRGSASYRSFQLNLVNPSGKIYSLLPGSGARVTADGRHTVPIKVSGAEAPGRVYPEPAPYLRDYPEIPFGYDSISYQGTTPNGCVVEINSGSATLQSPRVTFTAPNGSVSSVGLTGVTIPTHTTLTFDTTERTVTTRADNSATVLNRERYLVAPLVWPRLYPGINLNAPTTQARSRGYNRIDFSSSPAAAIDATMTVLFHEADLL
jgi:hypothetical protein